MSGHLGEVAGGVVQLSIPLCRLQDLLGLREGGRGREGGGRGEEGGGEGERREGGRKGGREGGRGRERKGERKELSACRPATVLEVLMIV